MHTTKSSAGLMTLLVAIFGAPAGGSGQNAPQPSPVVGTWTGALTVQPGAQLRLVFHVKQAADGTLSATMDSPDQGATGIPVSTVTVKGDSVRFEVSSAPGGAAFSGTMDEDRASIEGTWSQSGASLPLELTKGQAPGPAYLQEPEPLFPYRS